MLLGAGNGLCPLAQLVCRIPSRPGEYGKHASRGTGSGTSLCRAADRGSRAWRREVRHILRSNRY